MVVDLEDDATGAPSIAQAITHFFNHVTRQRHEARHDAVRCLLRQAGAMEDEGVELAKTPPAVYFVKPASWRTRTWSSSS